jgi:hypothetical protein
MVVDNEDEWDERIRQSLRYGVRILIKHPNINPTKITETLGLLPNLFHVAGTPRMTPKGKLLDGVHKLSTWSCWYDVTRNRLFFRDVVKLIDKFEAHRDFLHEIVDGGGSIDLIVNLPGDINIGDSFRWQDMARLSTLRIDLGIEVFPDFN